MPGKCDYFANAVEFDRSCISNLMILIMVLLIAVIPLHSKRQMYDVARLWHILIYSR